MKNKIITAILLATMLLSGCSAPTDSVKTSESSAKPVIMADFRPLDYSALSKEQYDEKAMEEEYLKFVFDFFSKTTEKTEKGNVMVSPASMMFA
ncbi:MAG: hypothetical protein J5786_05475, partial [Clostridiales bacterium]|nr:hypothetical protein [Clostridiales bacterium]